MSPNSIRPFASAQKSGKLRDGMWATPARASRENLHDQSRNSER